MTSLTQRQVQRIADECRLKGVCVSCNKPATTSGSDEDYPAVRIPLCDRCVLVSGSNRSNNGQYPN